MNKFNPFFLKYILSEDIPTYIGSFKDIKNVLFEGTSNIEDPVKFFAQFTNSDAETYAKFGEEVVRIELQYADGSRDVLYMIFRNARQERPDIGQGRYTFAKPSSVEVGYVDGNGAYNSFYKKHYSDWISGPGLTAQDANEMKLLTKTIEYNIINAIIGRINQTKNLQITQKPIVNGVAVFNTQPKLSHTTSNATNTDPVISQIAESIKS